MARKGETLFFFPSVHRMIGNEGDGGAHIAHAYAVLQCLRMHAGEEGRQTPAAAKPAGVQSTMHMHHKPRLCSVACSLLLAFSFHEHTAHY
jgi:hypothetical protein